VALAAPEDRARDRVELGWPPGVDVLLHRAPHLVGDLGEHRPERRLVDLRPVGARHRDRLVLAAQVALVVPHAAVRGVEPGRGEGDRCEDGELVPEERPLVVPGADGDPGALELGADRLRARQVHDEERRGLPDPVRRHALGLDADRGGDDVPVALAQARHVVDAVQERDHGRIAHALGRSELERSLELRRLGRHPEHVHVAFELGSGRHVHLEVPEHHALDGEPPAVALERRRPHEQNDVVPGPGERPADEAADPPRAENRVPHGRDPTGCSSGARSGRSRPTR
jgi:hypothetical protein